MFQPSTKAILKQNETNRDALLLYAKIMLRHGKDSDAIKVFLRLLIDTPGLFGGLKL